MTEQGRAGQCSIKVPRQTGRTSYEWDYLPCRRPAKFLADGKEFCWQHKPSHAEEILRRREVATPTNPRYLNSKQVAARYGHAPSWPRHCADLRRIARKVGKNLMWREDELEALETADRQDERKQVQVADRQRLEAKYTFTFSDSSEKELSDIDRKKP